MGNSSSSGGGGGEAVNVAPAEGPRPPRRFFTGMSSCDANAEAMVGVQFAPYNASDVGGRWGFGLSAVCAKPDGTTKVAKFRASGEGAYGDDSRAINTQIQACPADSYAVGVALADYGPRGLGVNLKCATMPPFAATNFEYLALRANATPGDPKTAASAEQAQGDYDARWAAFLRPKPTPSAPASTR